MMTICWPNGIQALVASRTSAGVEVAPVAAPILATVRAPQFSFMPEKPGAWHEPYPGWEPTRYEQKARREGRLVSFYFSFPRQ